MGKKAIIMLADGFEEIEAVAVIDILRRAGIDLTVAGVGGKNISSTRNLRVTADREADEISANDYDALILPGGAIGSKNLANSKKVTELIRGIISQGKLLAAICAAPAVVLAPIGGLDNKTATCYPGMEAGFPKSAKFKDEKVVADGNLITSQGPGTAMEFAFVVAERLSDREAVKKLKKQTLAD